jgi:hypothetical protein
MNHEGPTSHTFTQRRTTCGICKHHHCIGAFHVSRGPGGWREYVCRHPEAWEPVTDIDPKVAEMRGRLRAMEDTQGGRYIGRTEETPEWCPFTRPAEELKAQAIELARITTEATNQPKPRTPLFRGQR